MSGAALEAARRRLRPRSLRGQILAWLVPLHLGAALLAGWQSYDSYSATFHAFMDDQMVALATSYAAADPQALPPAKPLDDISLHEWGAFALQLWAPDGRLLASSAPDVAVPLLPQPGHHTTRASADAGRAWRVYTAPAGADGTRPRVQMLQSDRFRQEEVVRRTLFTVLPMALLVPVLLLILWWVVSRASRTLSGVAEDVARRNDHHLAALPLAQVPEEIAPLVASFNHLLERLDMAFAAQRRFVQDAAHELRTPMTALALQMDNLRRWIPEGAPRQQFAQLEGGMRRAHHLVEQLLRLSRQEAAHTAPAPAGESVDLIELLRQSVEQLMPLADRRRIEVSFESQVTPVLSASAGDLRSVFDNLLDNALRYTPEGGEVQVRVVAGPGRARVEVQDNGIGIPPELMERVFDRFFRVPGNAADGSGLGLAIARAAAAHQGLRVLLLPRPDGRAGLLARVELPAHTQLSPR